MHRLHSSKHCWSNVPSPLTRHSKLTMTGKKHSNTRSLSRLQLPATPHRSSTEQHSAVICQQNVPAMKSATTSVTTHQLMALTIVPDRRLVVQFQDVFHRLAFPPLYQSVMFLHTQNSSSLTAPQHCKPPPRRHLRFSLKSYFMPTLLLVAQCMWHVQI